jgi:hypothetical protein
LKTFHHQYHRREGLEDHASSRLWKEVEQLLQAKERAKEEATYIEDTERIATEIEMLKVIFYLVNRTSCSFGST